MPNDQPTEKNTGACSLCGELERYHCHARYPPETYHRINVEKGSSSCTLIHGHEFQQARVAEKPKLTAERALELASKYGSLGLDLSPPLDTEAARYLRAFAEQQATIGQLSEALIIYAQHYESCDGTLGADCCCECGLSDWLKRAREFAPNARDEDPLSASRVVAERDRTIEELKVVERALRKEVVETARTLARHDQSELRLYEELSELHAKLADYNDIANRPAIVKTYEIESEQGGDVPLLSRAIDLTCDRLVNTETGDLRRALASSVPREWHLDEMRKLRDLSAAQDARIAELESQLAASEAKFEELQRDLDGHKKMLHAQLVVGGAAMTLLDELANGAAGAVRHAPGHCTPRCTIEGCRD